MGLKKNGKKVRLQLHESVDSQESLEMDEYSDEDDEVFVRHDRDNEEAGKPLIKRRKKVQFKKISLKFRCCFGFLESTPSMEGKWVSLEGFCITSRQGLQIGNLDNCLSHSGLTNSKSRLLPG